MKALLLLAGRSRRFAPLSEKSLFPICGKTLAEHQVETMKRGGCTEIVLVTGEHNKKEIKRLFPDLTIVEQKNLDDGMQGAVLAGLSKIKMGKWANGQRGLSGRSESVLIVSGNDVIEPSAIKDVIAASKKPGIGGAILARKVKTYFPGGYLTVKGGKIVSIIEKPGEGNEPSKLTNIVAHVHNDPAALATALTAVKNHRDDAYEQALAALFATSKYVAVPYEGVWQPVKYPWHLLPLLELFLSHLTRPSIHPSATIHPSAVIDGNVVIGEGTRVLPNAVIVGPCVIGRNCIIGNNALVRGSSIGDDSVVGYNSEVKGSVLAGPVWTHMTYIGDSVIGGNVSFGGGCTTGNLRLDEAEIHSKQNETVIATGLTKFGLICGNDCRFGIQVGTNPGLSIGAGSFVAGGLFLSEDIPPQSFVMMKEGKLQIRANTTTVRPMKERQKYRKNL